MANSQLQIITSISGDNLIVTATVVPGGYLPANIFIYSNTGTTTLGDYQAVCTTDELTRLQVWTGVALPVFGNKFVRYNQAKIIVVPDISGQLQTPAQIAQGIASNLITSAQALSTALQTSSSTTQTTTIS